MSFNIKIPVLCVSVILGIFLSVTTHAQTTVGNPIAKDPISIGIVDVYEKDPKTKKRIRTIEEIENLINWHVTDPTDRLSFDRVVMFIDVLDEKEFRKALYALNRHISKGRDIAIVPLLKSRDAGPNARLIANGAYDAQLKKLASILRAKFYGTATTVDIRPLHEIDGDWYSWQRYYRQFEGAKPVNTRADVINAWRRVHDIFKNALGNNVRFEFSVNRRPAKGKVSTQHLREYYPGNSFVDKIVVSSYNRCGVKKQRDQRSFADEFDPIYHALLPLAKPIGIGETSTTSFCGYKGPWFKALFRDLYTTYPHIVNVDFYLNKAPSNRNIPWLLEDESQARSFYDGWKDLLKHRKQVSKSKAYFKNVEDKRSKYDYEYPWTVRVSAVQNHGVFNNAINPVTGGAFGEKGFVTSLYMEQGVVRPLERGNVGAYVYSSLLDSSNNNQWWNNKKTLGLKLKRCIGVPQADWGNLCAVVGTEWTDYTVDVPERLKGTTNGMYGGFKLNIGGQWLK